MTIASSSTVARDLYSRGRRLDGSPGACGTLADSSGLLRDADARRARMRRDGYLYLPVETGQPQAGVAPELPAHQVTPAG